MSEAAEQSISHERFGEVISGLRRRVSQLEEDTAQLEKEKDELQDKVDSYEQFVEIRAESADDAVLEDVWIAGLPVGKILAKTDERSREAVARCDDGVDEEDFRDEQVMRSQEDTKLRRRINALAEKADVELTDSDLMGDDKISTVMHDGPEAVVDGTPSKVHERAADLLLKIDEWGDRVSDTNGRRFVIKTGTAKDRLSDYRNETLQSVQVGRVFDKIEAWANSSPRDVTVDQAPDGQRRITVTVEAR